MRGRNQMEVTTTASLVPIARRLLEFPNESFVHCIPSKMDWLRCLACAKDVFNKHSSLVSHSRREIRPGVPSTHGQKLEKWHLRIDTDEQLKQTLVDYFRSHPDEAAGSRSADELLYRYRVAEAFVAVPPFERVDRLRRLLQRAGHALTGSQHLRMFIPQILEAEEKRLAEELADQFIGVAFDGTTRLGEAINVTGRWCTANFQLLMRLLDFTTLLKHVNNKGLAAHITNMLMTERRVPLAHVVNFARDSVSVNGAACRRLMGTFTSAADTVCFCHTLCHVGEHFVLPTLTELKTPWLELVGGRDPHRGAQVLWKEMVAVRVPGYSKVRWYSWAEILFVIAEAGMDTLGDFFTTLEQRDYGDATRKHLRTIYSTQLDALRLELAAMLDMRILVSTTYKLEGASPYPFSLSLTHTHSLSPALPFPPPPSRDRCGARNLMPC